MQYAIETKAVHAGRSHDACTGAVVPSISLSTTFKQREPAVPISKYEYSRSSNPNRDTFESTVAALENAKFGIAFASGLACLTTILQLLPKNSEILMINDLYGGTYRFFRQCASPLGFSIFHASISSDSISHFQQELEPLISENTALVWLESPTNPTLKLSNIESLTSFVKSLNSNTIVVADNTFLTPYYQRPLELGVDIVIHSVSKYLNGHSDVIMGVACTNLESLGHRLVYFQNALGTIPSPHCCWLASRGIQTFAVRMERISRNAMLIAEYLSNPACQSWVSQVYYPGLPTHPGHALLLEQQEKQHIKNKGFSGVISFTLKTNELALIKKFVSSCQLITLAESLGGVESLIEVPALMTHTSITEQDRLKMGITNSLIRLSVGIESAEDLIGDITQAARCLL